MPAIADDRRRGSPQCQPRARPPQQVLVELTPPDAEAHRRVVSRLDRMIPADKADAESREGLERPALTVLVRVEP
jgi:hypothetical protein